tara:strand:+ start:17876 stop:19336 length:1461 start_codon:yes stop_codon:yes gene_type:complete
MASIYYYIDIQEVEYYSESTAVTWGWYAANQYSVAPGELATALVAPSVDAIPPLETFSVGPIEFQDQGQYSIAQFMTKINDAFDTAYAHGDAPRLYQIQLTPRRERSPDGSALLSSTAGAWDQGFRPQYILNYPEGVAARDRGEILINYEIFNEERVIFKLLFHSGEHGSSLASTPSIPAGGGRTANSPPWATVKVKSKLNVAKAVEVPYCSISTTITDKPPVPPDILFVPYVSVNNKVLIMLNSTAGERLEKPIMLDDDDVTFIREEYISQHGIDIYAGGDDAAAVTHGDILLQYRSDDPVKKYEIFRVDRKPTNYQSFKGFRIARIEEKIGPDKDSTAASFIDTIQPNKKYWYCARAIDVHNNISNPTYIFEVEMVDNRGQMYFISKPIAFDTPMLNYKKQGRRYVAIRPRSSQTVYDPSSDQAANLGSVAIDQPPGAGAAILGVASIEDSIWEKKFKIRVTSKKTGRKIDLNVTFKNEGVIIP